MKSSVWFTLFFLLTANLDAQNIGVNTASPVSAFHIKSPGEAAMTIENATPLNTNIRTNLLFGNAIDGAGSYKYTGAIKTIGTSSTGARLGLFTGSGATPGSPLERISILNNGMVGISTTNPSYTLDVNGNTRLDGYVGIGTPPNVSYALSVNGSSRVYQDLRIDGVLNPNSVLNIGNNTLIEGTLTVQNGKGIVRSTSATQMKIKRASVGFAYTGLGAGSTATSGNLNFGEDFAAVTVTVGQCVSGTGDWAKVMIVPCNVDVNANTCQFAITNVSSSAITFDGSWQVVLVGN